ncbi:helix-turn-helix domain-containing protein [Ethanoligenens harbinense]|uniref:Helix-turn-helix domain protein n=1 Tax=Ethanoligenens harbinense (strain DSM 18485 / JCM 12961 / CGMCC 1.5033 / YUAN-3) TaxID=663278 RepID=E6U940_ETHHY|nr:helix-turn-helix transcriptional regulator [Ethanoligenens harbinense]ADU26104.1 helix-turn-helix domain protein [Ethanoligenens harbinense YUAN-3]AVQ95247.1 XRE family transcriptional regulator [Ethanoligenens harbinense YUAN-3]AYF37938.1 XRE family transcriptional regulator [Ethanoligenens harbinense]AYF40658.1 XRE family transcriptional regulator [Ethanoligenens harbinense]QCN91492.1 XRE family transcriptional regulator [Ethanoligenens harbinense]
MEFKDILISLLNQQNKTVYRLSKDIGVSPSLVGYWKKGEKTPSIVNMQKLADYFGVSVDYLLTGEKSPETDPPRDPEEAEIDSQITGIKYALSSLDRDAIGDLTIGEKKDVLKFINFLKSQRPGAKKKEGNSGDNP